MRRIAPALAICGALLLAAYAPESSEKYAALCAIGLYLILATGEDAVEGFIGLGKRLRLPEHVVGIVSSLASNLPEGLIAMFMAAVPHMREAAVLTVVLAAAFNAMLLGITIVLLTLGGGEIEVPRVALERDVEIARLTIVTCLLVAGAGSMVVLFRGVPELPGEAMALPLLAYGGYLAFVSRERREAGEASREWGAKLALGLGGIVVGAHSISSAVEFAVRVAGLHLVAAAILAALAGSVPEHWVAIRGARRGYVEMGISNLLSGIVQSVMLILPLVAFVAPIPLDGYILFQLLATAATLWLVKKAVVDDGKLTLDEGIFVILAQLMGLVLLDELSMLI